MHGEGRHRRVEAALLDGRAQDQAPVRARDQVAALEAQRALQQRLAAQPDRLALDRAHRQRREVGAPRTGRDHDLLGIDLIEVRNLCARAQHDARPVARGHQRCRQRARFGGVIVGELDAQPDARRQRRLERARRAREQPLRAQAEPLAQVQLALERGLLVAVARDRQRAMRP